MKTKSITLDYAIVFSIMVIIFAYIMLGIVHSDLIDHAYMAQEMLLQNKLFKTNFLMYFGANLLSGFTGNILAIRVALVLLIAIAETFKYALTKEMLKEYTDERSAAICSISLLVVYILPFAYFLKAFGFFESAHYFYLPYMVPNVWHNSTIICSMPFAIAAYWLSVKQFESYDSNRNFLVALLILLCVLVKPSFFFVYAISYPIILFARYKFSKPFISGLLPLLVGFVAMGYEYSTIYVGSTSGVVIDAMRLLDLSFWKSKILYIVTSLSFPIVFIIMYWRDIHKDYEFWFIIFFLISAIGISYVCKETGPREFHGNFSWQIIPSMWFMFLYIAKTIVTKKSEALNCANYDTKQLEVYRVKWYLTSTLFVLHTLMGVVYIMKYFITNSYY